MNSRGAIKREARDTDFVHIFIVIPLPQSDLFTTGLKKRLTTCQSQLRE